MNQSKINSSGRCLCYSKLALGVNEYVNLYVRGTRSHLDWGQIQGFSHLTLNVPMKMKEWLFGTCAKNYNWSFNTTEFRTFWEGVITEFLRNCFLKCLVKAQLCVETTSSALPVHLAYTAKNLDIDLNDMFLQSEKIGHQKNMILPSYRNESNSHSNATNL